jgi:hypothetical protein
MPLGEGELAEALAEPLLPGQHAGALHLLAGARLV